MTNIILNNTYRPQVLAQIDAELQRQAGVADVRAPSNKDLLERMALYAEREIAAGERLSAITRHMLGLLAGQPGAREYRRLLSEGARAPGADASLLRRAQALVS